MAPAVQIVTLALAALCAFASGQSTRPPCVPEKQTETCCCSSNADCIDSATQKPPLRIEILERDNPDRPSRPSYPSYPSFPNYPGYPSLPTYRLRPEYSVQGMPAMNMPEVRFIPVYSDLESRPNSRPMDLSNTERNEGYYMVPVGARQKVIKIPKE